jgi:MFS family permease
MIQYTIGAIFFGLATGINSPTIMAWTADLSPVARRGVGAGTVFIALESAIMAGALITLALYTKTMESARISYFAAAACGGIAILFVLWHLRKYPSESDLIVNSKKDPELLDSEVDWDGIQ